MLHGQSVRTHPSVMTRNVIYATGVPRVTTTKPLDSQPPALDDTKMFNRLEGISRTRRVETTGRPVERRNDQAISPQDGDQRHPRPPPQRHHDSIRSSRPVPDAELSAPTLIKQRRTSRSSCDHSAVAQLGAARSTTNCPGLNDGKNSRMRCLRRRCTRCLTTEFPTPFDTTNPILEYSGSVPMIAACTVTVFEPHLRPRRMQVRKSDPCRIRKPAGSTCTAVGSGRQLVAALAAPCGKDRAAGAGTHPQPEPVGLGPSTIIRLERPLTHR
jgi:hypothetical protein